MHLTLEVPAILQFQTANFGHHAALLSWVNKGPSRENQIFFNLASLFIKIDQDLKFQMFQDIRSKWESPCLKSSQ
jgi:hypothetical protein